MERKEIWYKDEEVFNVPGVKGSPIKDVIIKPLKKIPDERGAIYHMMRRDSELFKDFGEVYFSIVYPNVVKGWHLHEEMILNYAVPSGGIKLALYDSRKDSSTFGNVMEIFMGEDNYLLVQVPKLVWNGFKGIGVKPTIVCNCSTLAHDPGEIKRKDPFSEDIPYNWEIQHG